MKRLAFAILALASFIVMMLYPRDPGMGETIQLRAMNLSVSWAHPFGTDGLGRDLLARVQSAILGTVLPLWSLTILALGVGVLGAGLVANHRRIATAVERALLPLTTIPLFITVFFLAALFEKTGFWSVALPLMVLCAARAFQTFRGLLRESERLGYWQAHALMGGSAQQRFFTYGVFKDWRGEGERTMFFHLQVVLAAETALSYLGFGIAEPQASFGNMLASSYPLILKGEVGFALILVGVLSLVMIVPASLDAIGKYVTASFFAPREFVSTLPNIAHEGGS